MSEDKICLSLNQCSRLKPCPFCGTAPVYESDGGFNAEIKCPQCRQAIVKSIWYEGDLGTTEACWNKRHTEPVSGATTSADIDFILDNDIVNKRNEQPVGILDFCSNVRGGERKFYTDFVPRVLAVQQMELKRNLDNNTPGAEYNAMDTALTELILRPLEKRLAEFMGETLTREDGAGCDAPLPETSPSKLDNEQLQMRIRGIISAAIIDADEEDGNAALEVFQRIKPYLCTPKRESVTPEDLQAVLRERFHIHGLNGLNLANDLLYVYEIRRKT
jgi:hypothetical protein